MGRFIDGVKAALKRLKEFACPEDNKKPEGFVEVVVDPDIKVKVRINENSSIEEIKEIVCKAIDLSFSGKVELR